MSSRSVPAQVGIRLESEETAQLNRRNSLIHYTDYMSSAQMYAALPRLGQCRGDWVVREIVKSHLRDRRNYEEAKQAPLRAARLAKSQQEVAALDQPTTMACE